MLRSLGLGGDGDEVDAIEAVERALGIVFETQDCELFITVGDVWRAVIKEARLSSEEAEAEGLWSQMAKAISKESGVDPDRVSRDTLLLAEPVVERLGRSVRRLLRR